MNNKTLLPKTSSKAINYKQGRNHRPLRLGNRICVSHTSVQAAATCTQHSGSNERLDPHKRSAQLDFLEKIPGVYERARACGCPGETATEKKPKYWRDKGREDGEQKEENETTKEGDLDEERRQEERRREGKGGGKARSGRRRIRRYEGRKSPSVWRRS